MEAKFTVFCCEDTVDGIFTAVYEAWASGRGLNYVTVQVGEFHNYQLFTEYRTVSTDADKAWKVSRAIQNKMGMEDYENLYCAALSKDSRKGEVIFRSIVFGLAVYRRKNITGNLQEACIAELFELSRKVKNESHRYRMFVRFHELEGARAMPALADERKTKQICSREELEREEGAILFSEIEPENQVLPLLGEHFSDRFPMVNFMIYDHTHRMCLVHPSGGTWMIWQDVELEKEDLHRYSRKEEEYTRLWKGFVSSISIEERKNLRCQMNFMPKKYWKYMTEWES